jgi:lytic murein transglycosylase
MMNKRIALSAACALALVFASAPALANAETRACLNGLRGQAAQAGVPAAVYDRLVASVQPDMEVLAFLDRQPEFRTPIWDYLAGLVDEERVEDGVRAMRQHASALAAAEQRFNVPRYVIAAIWGVESNYGQNMGRRPLLESLTALACNGRRQSFFRGELFATMRIIHNGDIPQSDLRGSWAGAFGQTQFIPSTFQRLAVDMDGNGRRDIVNSVADAVGSTGNYLARAGWRPGLRWGYEVQLPRGFQESLAGRTKKRDIGDWRRQGVRRMDGSELPGSGPRAVLLPAGINGPAFLVSNNFDAIFSYNQAESYALAISILSDRLEGLPGIQAPWPTDDPPLSRAERRELQTLLLRRGYDIGEVDGIIGAKSREAVRDVQGRLGMETSGRAGGKLLRALRGG